MKALYENIESKRIDTSFVAYHSVVPYFEFKWHYHPEYELTLITKGSGKRLVGDSYESFTEGDLVLLGSGLPHTWMSEPQAGSTSAVVIQFSESLISSFTRHIEFAAVKQMLANAAIGLYYPQQHCRGLVKLLKTLPDMPGAQRMLLLAEVLQRLTECKNQALSSPFFASPKGKENEDRINRVCGYIQNHASEHITLQHVASLVHLTPSAFCKFFKRVTGKTFSDYVNDIRTGHACRLLTETDLPVGEIAVASGFESLTYFNRVFLKKKGVTPVVFRKGLRQI